MARVKSLPWRAVSSLLAAFLIGFARLSGNEINPGSPAERGEALPGLLCLLVTRKSWVIRITSDKWCSGRGGSSEMLGLQGGPLEQFQL